MMSTRRAEQISPDSEGGVAKRVGGIRALVCAYIGSQIRRRSCQVGPGLAKFSHMWLADDVSSMKKQDFSDRMKLSNAVSARTTLNTWALRRREPTRKDDGIATHARAARGPAHRAMDGWALGGTLNTRQRFGGEGEPNFERNESHKARIWTSIGAGGTFYHMPKFAPRRQQALVAPSFFKIPALGHRIGGQISGEPLS